MPVRNSVITGALIAGTVATAAGLNLAVMGLDRTEANAAEPADEVVAASVAAEVELTSAEIAPDIDPAARRLAAPPVLAVGLTASPSALTETPAPAPAAPVAPSTALTPTTADESPTAPSAPETSSSRPLPSTQPTPSPPTTGPLATTASQPTTSPPTTPVSTEYLTYEFDGVATVVVALHDGEGLEFWSVDVEEGWAFMVEDHGPRDVKIKFRPTGGGDEAEFEVKLDDGRLKVKREY